MPGKARLVARTAAGARFVSLASYLDGAAVERTEREANAWIKSLRHARVEGAALRDRFILRGDSLWWFAELYLHKRRVVARALRSASALAALVADLSPSRLEIETPDPVLAHVARTFCAARRLRLEGATTTTTRSGLASRAKAVFHMATAMLDRVRPSQRPDQGRARVAAFVHSAFWRRDQGEESYIGPVLRAVEARMPGGLRLVGVGPRTNFRVRRWRDRLDEFSDPAARALPLTPVEQYAGWRALGASREVWSRRGETMRALTGSADLRTLSVVDGLDLWPLIVEELRGIADLQFPWSARAMDEAAAALDALAPEVVVTYAEAGGWGRALVLEARRRRIASVGVQHGFIYRHWLNYLHEPDEMAPSAANPADTGFPRPDRTLVFDGFAAEHLRDAGRFPPASLEVTGSPRMEGLVDTACRLDAEDRAGIRQAAGIPDGPHIILVAAKHAQLGPWFAHLVAAAAGQPDLLVVVKPHPAESGEPYVRDAAGAPHVTVAPADADLARLTSIARVLVTAHSTAAIEAMAIGVPALVVGLPTNLTPFVDGGAMAGVSRPEDLASALGRIVRDEAAREAMAAGRAAFLERYGMVPAPGAADRAGAAITALAGA